MKILEETEVPEENQIRIIDNDGNDTDCDGAAVGDDDDDDDDDTDDDDDVSYRIVLYCLLTISII